MSEVRRQRISRLPCAGGWKGTPLQPGDRVSVSGQVAEVLKLTASLNRRGGCLEWRVYLSDGRVVHPTVVEPADGGGTNGG
jgi:hypothetical protein